MAEMAGGAFLGVVFQKLFEQLASPELRKNSVASKLKELEEKLKRVRLYLDDAEDKQLFDKKVKEWLDELKHVVFMADDMVEEINNSKKVKKSKRKAVTRAFKSVYRSLAKTVQGEIDLILMDLDGLLGQAPVLELKHVQGDAQSSRSDRRIIAPLREEQHVFGREAEKEEIWKFLLSGEDKIRVLPIVGMGGLGKTTLAQLVYNDKRVEEHGFTLKAWVTVSTEFDFCRIMKELLEKVSPGTSTSSPNELQQLLKEAVRGKRFLFVLDDVWDENYSNWDLLMSNFTAGDRRSRVIVTTRSGVVGSIVKTGPIHELEEVHKDDCWSIFVHHAFNGDTNADPELQEIGRRIVAKCKGLPLAIRCLGGLLRSERSPQKWENILRSDVGDWSKVMENGVLPSLWLSYRYLSSSLKQCFAYCSIFPQDYEFNKKRTVSLWMAEGFIPSNEEGKSMEEVGEEYFDDLVSRSLFQIQSSEDFVMHDLVHDLAAFVYGKFCFRIGDDLKNVTIRTRHLSYDGDVSSNLLTSLSTSKHLRTFMNTSLSDGFVKEMVTKVRCLRVLSLSLEGPAVHHSLGDLKLLRFLDLSFSEIEQLPNSICSLFHLQTLLLSSCWKITRLPTEMGKLVKLQYLDLSFSEIKELPNSICSLFHLQTLLLSSCRKITRLPTEMGKLVKLRHLDTKGTRLTKMPPKMGDLKELRILRDFVLGEADDSGCSSLKELGELQHLGGKLCISKLQNVDNVEDAQKANVLRDKAELKELALEWERDTSNTRTAVDVLEALRPHTNLERLKVYNYPGSSFLKWVGETSFSKMVSVNLSGVGSFCRFLPPLGQLPSLRELHIEGFEGVEKIGNELLYGNDNSSITPFPCLEALWISKLSSWKEWSFVGNESGCFSSLKALHIERCPKLKCIARSREDSVVQNCPEMESTSQLPTNDTAFQNANELESLPYQVLPNSLWYLTIVECPLLERRYQKHKGNDWHYISHIPEILISGLTTNELEREEKKRRLGKNSASQNV